MTPKVLTLYSRQGCCLCEGLEARLRSIPLGSLQPPLVLSVVDIDRLEIPKDVKDRYDLQVPVLLIGELGLSSTVELPRVSPRLNQEGLLKWLQKCLVNIS